MRLAAATFCSLLTLPGLTTGALSQELSSSLYSTGDEFFADPFADELGRHHTRLGQQSDTRNLSPAIAAASFMAVGRPEPRAFAMHDLITIVIREDTRTDFKSSLETEKETKYEAKITEFPRLSLSDLLDAQIRPNTFADGRVALDLEGGNEFKGEGDYSNAQSMTGRIQAEIIDIKPNGNIVVEARKSVRSDKEHYTLVATGTCRVDDITTDNTILSSQLADLYIDKQHEGYLRRSSNKGLLTEVLDFLFPW